MSVVQLWTFAATLCILSSVIKVSGKMALVGQSVNYYANYRRLIDDSDSL